MISGQRRQGVQGQRRTGGFLSVVANVVLGAALLGACTPQSASGAPGIAGPRPSTPLATSLEASGGSWATVPMGRLDNLRDTFWQLLFRPSGSTSWTDRVAATATATNGGLVLASAAGAPLVVGIRPSLYLSYTPIIATSDAGATWSNGLLDRALAAYPDALAVQPGGALAITANGEAPGSQVVESARGFASWRKLIGVHQLLAGASGRACRPDSLSAVGSVGGTTLLGTACTRRGVVGLFEEHPRGWQLVGPAIPSSLARRRIGVLGLYPEGASRMAALMDATGSGANGLFVTWLSGGAPWRRSAPLALPSGQKVASYGPLGTTGIFVLSTSAAGTARLDVIGGTGGIWRQLPAPPARTSTVAAGPGGAIDALAPDGTVLTIWTLGPASTAWTRSQALHVPIAFGTSG
ncbi:MAG: hypothetical protein ACYDDZ_11720 [Acidimicrobiales bacterium]